MIRHVGIVVKNLTESIEFYRMLGFTLVHSTKREDSNFIDKISASKNVRLHTTRVINSHGNTLEFLEYDKHTINKQSSLFNMGLAHFALTVKNILDLNVSWISPPIINPEKTVRVGFCLAPEGTHIEIVEEL